jgi:hypothetical protein
MSSRSNLSGNSQLTRAVPPVLAVLTVVCGLFVPRNGALYLLGHSLALVLAIAVPISYGWLNRRPRFNDSGVHWFLLIGLGIFGVISALSSVKLVSYGSTDGAAGDTLGIFIWLLSTAGSLVLSIAAAITWPKGTRTAHAGS